jgi:prevent-host-death family protein
MTSLGVAEFKSRFSEVLTGLLERHERVVVERRGRPVAVLVSLDDAKRLDPDPLAAENRKGVLGFLGTWDEHPDIDGFVDDVYRDREASLDRDVEPLG